MGGGNGLGYGLLVMGRYWGSDKALSERSMVRLGCFFTVAGRRKANSECLVAAGSRESRRWKWI